MIVTEVKRVLFLIFCVLTASHPAWGEVLTVPLRLGENGYIYIDGKIENKKVTFLLDTGSSPSIVLKNQVGDTLRLKTADGEVPDTVLKDGRYITGFAAEIVTNGKPFPMPAAAQESAISADLGAVRTKEKFDGLVGMAWFEGYSMVVDCRKKTLTLYSGEDSPELTGVGYVTGGRIRGGVTEVLLHFGDGEKKIGSDYFVMDTGAVNILLKSDVLQKLSREKQSSDFYYTATSDYIATTYKVKKLTFGNFTVNDFGASQTVQNDKNVLGVLFLSQFRVYISADRRTIGFFTF